MPARQLTMIGLPAARFEADAEEALRRGRVPFPARSRGQLLRQCLRRARERAVHVPGCPDAGCLRTSHPSVPKTRRQYRCKTKACYRGKSWPNARARRRPARPAARLRGGHAEHHRHERWAPILPRAVARAGRLSRARGWQQKLQRDSCLISSENRQVIRKADAKRRRERSQEQRVHTHLVERSEVRLQKSALLLFRKPIVRDQSFTLAQKPIKHLWLTVDVE